MDNALVPGDVREAILERWLSDYGNAILRLCFMQLSSATLAEDAMQDTFVKAWRAMDTFEGRNGCGEKTWLMRIAMNTCRDYRRSAWLRRVELTDEMEKLSPCVVPAQDRTLFLDIMRLPARQRQVLLLYYYQNMTIQETAEALGIHPSSAYQRLKRAEAALRRTLEGGDGHEA